MDFSIMRFFVTFCCLLGIISCSSAADDYLEGLKLKNVGFVKFIINFSDLEVKFDLDALKDRLFELKQEVEIFKESECNSEECQIKMDGYREVLIQHELELGLTVKTSTNKHSRAKRWDTAGSVLKYFTGNLDADDGRALSESIDNLQNEGSQNAADVRALQEKLEELQEKLRSKTEDKPLRNEREERLAKEVFATSDELASMMMTMLAKKFSGNLTLWEEKLETIFEEKNLNSSFDQEFGLSLTESLNILDVEVQISPNEIKMILRVPIVEKEKKLKLTKLIGMPTKSQNFVLYTDFKMNHLAISDDSEIKTVGNLNECIIASSDQVYLCKPDTEETVTNFCLKNTILFETIDMGVCADNVFVAKLPDAVMIVNDFGDLWFSSENHRSIEIACKDNDKKLSVYGSGSVDLEKCGLNEDNFDDIPTTTVFYSNMEKLNITGTIAPPLLEDSRLYTVSEFMQNAVTLSDLTKKSERRNIMMWIYILFTVTVFSFIVLDVYRRRSTIREKVNVTSKKFQRINDAMNVATK